MEKFALLPFNSDMALGEAVAREWLAELESNGATEPYHVALSGGRSAQVLFDAIGKLNTHPDLWKRVHFFWADERCLPPEDPESNFRLAQERLFSPLHIGNDQVHRIRGEESPEIAAQMAQSEIIRILGKSPVLDLILLGMGEDGHVASLFPGETNQMRTDSRIYRAITDSPKPPPNRITIGYQTMRMAREVWVLILGKSKEKALRDSCSDDGQTPLAKVIESRLKTRLFAAIG